MCIYVVVVFFTSTNPIVMLDIETALILFPFVMGKQTPPHFITLKAFLLTIHKQLALDE